MENNTMKNNKRIIYGLIITIIVFVISLFAAKKLNLDNDFIPNSFITHSTMLLLAILAIYSFKKNVNYKISLPKFKNIFKPILFGLLATIVINISIIVITKLFGYKIEAHFALKKMSPLQIFIFVFIYASIAEEILFRGFLMNILKPIRTNGIKIFKRNISISVIISAFAFGLAHLILITSGASGIFLLRIVIFTTIIGLIAGYYQEKYDNNAFAIIVHMSSNLIGVIGSLLIN